MKEFPDAVVEKEATIQTARFLNDSDYEPRPLLEKGCGECPANGDKCKSKHLNFSKKPHHCFGCNKLVHPNTKCSKFVSSLATKVKHLCLACQAAGIVEHHPEYDIPNPPVKKRDSSGKGGVAGFCPAAGDVHCKNPSLHFNVHKCKGCEEWVHSMTPCAEPDANDDWWCLHCQNLKQKAK
jgi:hypothetical protein